MARIVIEAWVVQYPMAGAVSCILQWMLGFKRLGYDVYFFEKAPWEGCSCNIATGVMSDDCSYGTAILENTLSQFGLAGHWCFVDYHGNHYGLSRDESARILDGADLFIDMGLVGAWHEEASRCDMRVLFDVEPGRTQVWGKTTPLREYDYYYTPGACIASGESTVPDLGVDWRPVFNPVAADVFRPSPGAPSGPYTTVMQWQAHQQFEYDGKRYGQKDLEFPKFLGLPGAADVPIQIAASGAVPRASLEQAGWAVRDTNGISTSLEAYLEYIRQSRGEFSVAKQTFVAFHTGWFSERSALYMALGRPVVLQDTGFSRHLPCGEGLFAVNNVEEAAEAIREIEADWERHSRAARRIAVEYLDTDVIVPRFLDEIGISSPGSSIHRPGRNATQSAARGRP